jgi:NitT/TauT family transport system ATP-binding protein
MGDAMADVIVRLRVEHKGFRTDRGELPVLGRIELALHRREIVAIVGPSGCGKTTLLRIVGGLEREFQGALSWCDGDAPRIGTVFQEPRLLPWRTVRQNLLLVQRIANPGLVDALLQSLDLALFRDAFPAKLSLGMARRAAIGRALAVEPELLLLDEPFVSLDAATAARGRELLMQAWRARPTTVVLVTHDREEAATLAHRILELGGRPARIRAEMAGQADDRHALADADEPGGGE